MKKIEIYFVNWHSILSESQLSVNEVDHCLICGVWYWQRLMGQESVSSSEEWYDFNPLKIMRGLVFIIRDYRMFHELSCLEKLVQEKDLISGIVDDCTLET